MKQYIIALALVSGFAAIPAMAGDLDTVRFECPKASGGVVSENLFNYGTYIRGMGEENVELIKTRPIFHGVPTAGVASNLANGGYSHAGAEYNPTTGRVTCKYTSSLGFDAFDVSYVASNMLNGHVIKADNSKVTIEVYAG